MLRRSRGGARLLAQVLVVVCLESVSDGAAFSSSVFTEVGKPENALPGRPISSDRIGPLVQLRAHKPARAGARVSMGVSAPSVSAKRAPAPAEQKPGRPAGSAGEFRAFKPGADDACVPELCQESWDYLPRSLPGLLASPDDFPHVLQDGAGKVVAIGNVQRMDATRGWVQAIRVHPERKGEGFGTAMTEHLAALCTRLGARCALTSTTADNLPMLRVFDKTGFRRVAAARSFPTLAIVESVAERHAGGVSYLNALGVAGGGWDDARLAAAAAGFQPCGSAAEAAATLDAVVTEARAAGVATLPVVIAEYRVFSLQQPEVQAALAAGRVFVRAAGPDGRGAALLVVRRAPTMRGRWIAGLTAADARAVRPALARAALAVGTESFQLFFSELGGAETAALFSDRGVWGGAAPPGAPRDAPRDAHEAGDASGEDLAVGEEAAFGGYILLERSLG
jgi:ribosomal protein S18 acetylase RimI-like enzyme